MINPLYAGIGGAAGALVLSFSLYTWGHSNGKEAERLKWEIANKEELFKLNEGLARDFRDLQAEAARSDEVNQNANQQLSAQDRIIRDIVEVPVDRLVYIDGECPGASINYGTVSLLNRFATGGGVTESVSDGSSANLSGGLPPALPGNTGND